MARLTDRAAADIDELAEHFEKNERFEAAERLSLAVASGMADADRVGKNGRRFPAVYETLARPGHFWIKTHRYWFCYFMDKTEAVIVHVFYEQADIPGRFRL